jgi:hypothetical protein
MGEMIRLDEEVDVNIYERYYGSEYSNQQKNQKKNQPTHFSLERKADGFDKVRYYRIKSK